MKQIHEQPERLREYNELVLSELAAIEPIDIAAVVSASYVLDFVILYESLLESWGFYPFRLHAFTAERETYERLSLLELEHAEAHLLDEGAQKDWAGNALAKIRLIEASGLDRCLVSDVDNVFLTETPELFLLLNRFDLVFVGSPVDWSIIQTNLWSFRRNDRTAAFSRHWYEHSRRLDFADASGLPFALLENRDDLEIKVLVRPKPDGNERFLLAPYDVQANVRPFELRSDWLGFREAEMGRAKVLHLGRLRPSGAPTIKERIATLVQRFPETVSAFPLYFELANRAAERLGMETEPFSYVRERSYRAGVLGDRDELPALLNQRGLTGRGAQIGGADGRFSELMLRHWRGAELISIDPWTEPSSGEAEDAAARVDPGSLDFVYLDVEHDDEAVKHDLEHWFEKVRPGGIVAGRAQSEARARSTVDEFFAGKGLKVKATFSDASSGAWFVEIP